MTASVATWVLRFARVSPGAGAHLAFRCLGFPHYRAVERRLPASGRILDLGCGHGLLALLAAEGGPRREIVGIDRLEKRVGVGRRVAERHGLENVRFEVGDLDEPPRGPFEAITLADVLMYRPLEAQRALLERLVTHLTPGGSLVFKEQTREPAWKARLVAAQEWLVLGSKIRLGRSTPWSRMAPSGIHLWETVSLTRTLEDLGMEARSERLDRWSYLSHRLFTATRPWDLPAGEPRPAALLHGSPPPPRRG